MFEAYTANWGSVIVATLASFIISMLWYSKFLFGKAWMRLSGITAKTMNAAKQKSMVSSMITALILGIISSFVLANFISWLSITDSISGLRLALWLWLGFFVPTEAGRVLWEGKSWSLYFLNVCHYLATLSVSAIILAAWH